MIDQNGDHLSQDGHINVWRRSGQGFDSWLEGSSPEVISITVMCQSSMLPSAVKSGNAVGNIKKMFNGCVLLGLYGDRKRNSFLKLKFSTHQQKELSLISYHEYLKEMEIFLLL